MYGSNAGNVGISFSLLNSKEFTVRCEYGILSQTIVSTVKNANGAFFDFKNHKFVLPLQVHDSLHVALHRCGCCVEALPRNVLSILQLQQRKDTATTDPAATVCSNRKIPEQIDEALAPFQRDGVDFVVKNNGRALIADEMGLGDLISYFETYGFK